jgi:D-amino peptidase
MKETRNVFISFDIEGVSAVASWREVRADSKDTERLRRLATQEVNAAVRGARKSGMNTGDITICDAHASGENLLVEEIDAGVNLVKGTPRKYYMMHGIDRGYDVVFFIGYHAMAGTPGAGMDHTYSSASIYNVRINGADVGESAINAALAGYYGVPLGLAAGDDRLVAEIRKFFGPSVETVVTKRGVSRFAARCRHPADVQAEIETKAARAVQKIDRLNVFRFKEPLRAEIDLVNTVIADLVELIPGIRRTGGRNVGFRAKDILEFYRMLRLICCLGGYANVSY